tara:strand:+ start:132 stop:1160 length:1029 start_codon:yes stop_codon:yes gene_type:complete
MTVKFNEVAGRLATLEGTHNIQDLVNLILSIANFNKETLKNIERKEAYGPFDERVHKLLKDILVDMTYQRRVRLRKLINKLISEGSFNPNAAGHIDIADRGDSSYVWDGLRRCLMAGITGSTYIAFSRMVHHAGKSQTQCQEDEAKLFKIRNAESEKMKPEEIFKSKICYREPQAMKLLEVLKNAKLDVENLNPQGKKLGGFRLLEESLQFDDDDNSHSKNNRVKESYVVSASNMIQEVWYDEPQVSVYLLCGLAKLLQYNDEVLIHSNDYNELKEKMRDVVHIIPKKRQTEFTDSRLNSKPIQSIAYILAKNIFGEMISASEFIQHINISEDDIDNIESLN